MVFKKEYLSPDDKYISCEAFSNIDGMDGACHYCKEETPLQFEMCWDANWLRSLIKHNGYTKEEAIEFINKRKSR